MGSTVNSKRKKLIMNIKLVTYSILFLRKSIDGLLSSQLHSSNSYDTFSSSRPLNIFCLGRREAGVGGDRPGQGGRGGGAGGQGNRYGGVY